MSELFVFIYCQPMNLIMLCMLLLPILWAFFGYQGKNGLRWRIANSVLFMGIVAVIFFITVYARGESPSEAVLIPFQSFQEAKIQPELYRSMLMNVFLFVPIGLSLPFVLHKRSSSIVITVLFAFLFSTLIEYLQFRYSLGRCEVDDVIMNTLGAVVGCLAYGLYLNWERFVVPGFHLLKETVHHLRRKSKI